jgi:hypothetical protein
MEIRSTRTRLDEGEFREWVTLARRRKGTRMIHINCNGPESEDTGAKMCPVRPDSNEYNCGACKEYQALCTQYENALNRMQSLEKMIWNGGK